jgi:hypothetical protein
MKHRVFSLLIGTAAFALAAAPAYAQKTGSVGLVIGGAGGVGLLWHVTDNVAIRPDISFSRLTSESTILSTTSNSRTTSVGFGASGLFYVGKWDSLRTYVSPQFRYTHSNSTSGTPSTTTTSSGSSVNGMFGAQYALGERFAVFGETGLAYTWQPGTTTIGSTFKSHSFGTRSTLGVTWYF